MNTPEDSPAANDTIAALATGPGGAIAVVRVSGPRAIEACDALFRPASGHSLSSCCAGTLSFGCIVAPDGSVVDEAVAALFRSPRSYTGEDTVELSCHASPYIIAETLRLLSLSGVRQAEAGEFTMRAFLAGRLDLSQAEAIADLIAAADRASHRIALDQMRGSYRQMLASLRDRLLKITSLLELELDFSEEDVEFADRSELSMLLDETASFVGSLASSFELGNVVKEGVPVAIVGPPNAGKSTLLNALLGEERAMVSDIPGTTRDTVEGRINIKGISYRLTDTAGLRESEDKLERMGVERSYAAAAAAAVVLLVYDIKTVGSGRVADSVSEYSACGPLRTAGGTVSREGRRTIAVLNKADTVADDEAERTASALARELSCPVVTVSAKEGRGLDLLAEALTEGRDADTLLAGGAVVSNARHYEAFVRISDSLTRSRAALDEGTPSDLVAHHLRDALYHLATVTGQQITSSDVLSEIFSKFCVGK